MCHALRWRRVFRWTTLAGSVLLLSSGVVMPLTSQHVLSGPCFAIADNVVCMEEPMIVSMPPVMPSMPEPSRAGGERSDDSVEIRDDGGYERDIG